MIGRAGLKFVLVVLILLVGACSMLNREGPDVSCKDLGNGSENACKDGIIATCLGGPMWWQVCEDQSACDQSWQTSGAYRCKETDSLPALAAGGGTGGSRGVGTGGGPSTGGTPIGAGGASAVAAAVAACGSCPTGYRQVANACNTECGGCACDRWLCVTTAQYSAGVGLRQNACDAGMHSILSVPDCDGVCGQCGTRELCVPD
jgi:hypothetical protein